MRLSDGLLLFYGHIYTSRTSVPGKLYEYLRIGRPILAVAHEGGVKELIGKGKAGWVARPESTGEIKQALRSLLEQIRSGVGPQLPDPDFVAQFEYEQLARNLASIFNKVASQ